MTQFSTLSPQKFREIVLQILYSFDEVGAARSDDGSLITLLMDELKVSKKNVRLAYQRALEILEKQKELDEKIELAADSYALRRLHLVILNILRIATFELFYDSSIPPKVAIAEAIRLAKKFNTPESASFTNALVDHLFKIKEGVPVEKKNLSLETFLEKEDEIVHLAQTHIDKKDSLIEHEEDASRDDSEE